MFQFSMILTKELHVNGCTFIVFKYTITHLNISDLMTSCYICSIEDLFLYCSGIFSELFVSWYFQRRNFESHFLNVKK